MRSIGQELSAAKDGRKGARLPSLDEAFVIGCLNDSAKAESRDLKAAESFTFGVVAENCEMVVRFQTFRSLRLFSKKRSAFVKAAELVTESKQRLIATRV